MKANQDTLTCFSKTTSHDVHRVIFHALYLPDDHNDPGDAMSVRCLTHTLSWGPTCGWYDVQEAGPALQPHVVDFLMVLLEALSGMENPILDYVATRLDTHTKHQDALDDARVSASRSSPLMDCITLVLEQTSADQLPVLIERVCDVIKTGIGSSTKSGCAYVATQLAAKFRGGDMAPHTNALLKALFKGAVSKSAPLRREFANAIGHVVRVAPTKDLNFVVKRCRRLYEERSSDEAVEASAAVCFAISRRSPDVLQKLASSLLPLAFLGMHDASVSQ